MTDPVPAAAADPAARLSAATYTVAELAGLLQCSERHVHRLHDQKLVPGVIRAGRLLRFHRRLVDEWLAAGCPRPTRR